MRAICLAVTVFGFACEGGVPQPESSARECIIERVVDGDTIRCSGERIRLLLIDAPEQGQGDFGLRSRLALEEMLPVGSRVTLETDIEVRDQYGRLLAHVYARDGTWANREMARRGYALTLVYPPNVRHVERLRVAADSAREEGSGLWSDDGFGCEPRSFRRGDCQ